MACPYEGSGGGKPPAAQDVRRKEAQGRDRHGGSRKKVVRPSRGQGIWRIDSGGLPGVSNRLGVLPVRSQALGRKRCDRRQADAADGQQP